MFPTSSEPNSPTALADRQNAVAAMSIHSAGVSVSNSRRSMATLGAPLPPLSPRAHLLHNGAAIVGMADGSDAHDRDAVGGTGKIFTVTPDGGMKTAANFSGELFQVVDTKAGASPQGSALTDNVAGILYKWVNYGKGWRPRWFALKDGVFSYYKVHGHDKVTLSDNRFKSFRIIGEEAQKLMKKQNSKQAHPHIHLHLHSSSDSSQFRASGEIHLKVCCHRESIDCQFCPALLRNPGLASLGMFWGSRLIAEFFVARVNYERIVLSLCRICTTSRNLSECQSVIIGVLEICCWKYGDGVISVSRPVILLFFCGAPA